MSGKGERMHQIATNLTICSRESKAITISMYSSFMVLSLVGNSLLIAVFYRNKSLRTPVHCFIMNMTLSDLIIPIISLPTAIIRLTYHDSTILCKIVSLVGCVSSVVSMSSMVAIAFDRFYAIVFPMKPPLFSQTSCQRVIIITWIVSVAIQGYYFDMYCDKSLGKYIFLLLLLLHSFHSHPTVFNYNILPLPSENGSSSGEWNSQTKSKGKQKNYFDVGDHSGSILSLLDSFSYL